LNFANVPAASSRASAVNPTTGGPANGLRHFALAIMPLFLDDSWKVRPNLTLTLGLAGNISRRTGKNTDQLTNYVLGSQGVVNAV